MSHWSQWRVFGYHPYCVQMNESYLFRVFVVLNIPAYQRRGSRARAVEGPCRARVFVAGTSIVDFNDYAAAVVCDLNARAERDGVPPRTREQGCSIGLLVECFSIGSLLAFEYITVNAGFARRRKQPMARLLMMLRRTIGVRLLDENVAVVEGDPVALGVRFLGFSGRAPTLLSARRTVCSPGLSGDQLFLGRLLPTVLRYQIVRVGRTIVLEYLEQWPMELDSRDSIIDFRMPSFLCRARPSDWP